MNLIMTIRFMRSFFEVSSIAAIMLPSVLLMNLIITTRFMKNPFEVSSVTAIKLPKSCLVDASYM